ncbi:MFS transporter [Lactobacillus apis]|uniref:MFS transporter n=1 Tax=Lactobacillus apis TaxID=303541 RepID=UPI002432EB59|nr:MFS transporter [Lactobacillus apis]
MTTKKANLVFTTLLTGAIVTSLLQTSLTTALPKIMQELSLTALKAQWLTSAFSLAMAIMVPISAYLIKRYTTRQIFISSMILFSFGSLLSWYGSNFTVLLLGRIFQALGSGIVLPLTQVVIMTLYPTEKQGTAMGILGLASGAAPVIAPTLTGIAIDSWGWRSIFLIQE